MNLPAAELHIEATLPIARATLYKLICGCRFFALVITREFNPPQQHHPLKVRISKHMVEVPFGGERWWVLFRSLRAWATIRWVNQQPTFFVGKC